MEISAAIEKVFIDSLGLDMASLGRSCLERVAAAAMTRSGVADGEAYLELLSRSPEESEWCLEELLVPETWFFRDGQPFVLLKRYLQEQWFPAHPSGTLRILSAPCSTGEEPYSIAMTLLSAGIPASRFHLDAADISQKALAAARAALYGRGSFRQPLSDIQDSFFTAAARVRQVDGALAGMVHFRRGNMVAPEFFAGEAPYDIIFCRNLLIYLTAAARVQVLATLDRLLAPDGLLFAGHAEMGIFLQQGFKAIRHPRAFACCRAAKTTAKAPVHPVPRKRPPAASAAPLPARPKPTAVAVAPEPTPPARKPKEVITGALHAEALALADRGCFDEAAALCRRYIEEQPPHADVYCLLGLIHEAARRPEEAEACYMKALYLDPDHYETLIQVSLLCLKKGDSRNAALYRRRAEARERRPDGTARP